jgi:hypothetical protein
VFERRVPGDRRVVALNLSDASRTIEAEAFTGATVEVSTRRDRNDEKLEGELELMPLEGCIILPSH